MKLQGYDLSMPQGLRHFCLPPLLAIAASITFLFGVYALPMAVSEDVGTTPTTISGLYAPERNEHFSYAYLTGRSSLVIPHIGRGHVTVRLRIGGPKGELPVRARLTMPPHQLDFGQVRKLRVYHVLIPTDAQGNANLGIQSTTVRLPQESRQPGVLVDWVELHSLGAMMPTVSLLLYTPLILLFMWLSITQLIRPYPWQIGLLLGSSSALIWSLALNRGMSVVELWWLRETGELAALVLTSRLIFLGIHHRALLLHLARRGLAALFRGLSIGWEHPVRAAFFALMVYAALAIQRGPIWGTTKYAYYSYLADAFLHGQLHLRLMPHALHDLSQFQGRLYLYWGPMPAILLMPLTALFGLFSDILFTIGIAAMNVFVVALVLRHACRRRVISLSRQQRGMLVVFFALGTVHVILAPMARVWYTGQIVGFLFVALAYLATLSLHGRLAFLATGLAMSAALLTRNHLVFAGLWPACYLFYQHRSVGWRRPLSYALLGGMPVGVGVGLLLFYNWLRFGNAFDNGLAYHRMGEIYAANYHQYGAFSLHYVLHNLYWQYLHYPLPWRPWSEYGGSLFLLSPVFFAAWWGVVEGRPRWSPWILLGTILLVATPILMLMGTGWIQFGPRYTLDFTMPLLLLTALGLRRWPTWTVAVLVAISIVHYFIGLHYLSGVIPAW